MNKKYKAKIGRIWTEQELENRVTKRRKKLRISRQDTVKEELVYWKIVQSNLIVISVNIYKSQGQKKIHQACIFKEDRKVRKWK